MGTHRMDQMDFRRESSAPKKKKAPKKKEALDFEERWDGSCSCWFKVAASPADDSLPAAGPGPRCSHTATLVGERSLYIIGGGCVEEVEEPHDVQVRKSLQWRHIEDVHRLDLCTLRWHLEPARLQPARRGHSAAHSERAGGIIVFGGVSSEGGGGSSGLHSEQLLSEVQVFRLGGEAGSACFVHPEVAGALPHGRRAHRAVMLGEASMLVLGGAHVLRTPEDGLLEADIEMWLLRVGTAEGGGGGGAGPQAWAWSRLRVSGSVPQGLSLFGCALVGTQLFCYGGSEHPDATQRSCSGRLWVADLGPALDGTCAEYVQPDFSLARRRAAAPGETESRSGAFWLAHAGEFGREACALSYVRGESTLRSRNEYRALKAYSTAMGLAAAAMGLEVNAVMEWVRAILRADAASSVSWEEVVPNENQVQGPIYI